MSIGEDRVRIKFNPSDNSVVSQIKQKSAELIDLCNSLKPPENYTEDNNPGGFGRLKSLAMTAYEEAAMWAVKCATSEGN